MSKNLENKRDEGKGSRLENTSRSHKHPHPPTTYTHGGDSGNVKSG